MNVLALDVPVIAVTWQHLLMRPEAPKWFLSAALFGAVWTIYLADRWFDARRFRRLAGVPMPLRHAFFQQHPQLLLTLLGIVSTVSAVVAARYLSLSIWLGGGALALLVVVYFAWNQLAGDRWGRRWAKELLVGILFAAGCGWTAVLNDPSAIPATCALAWVAFLNCLLIARLDCATDVAAGIQSLGARKHLRPGHLALFIGFSVAGVLLLFAFGERMPRDAAPVGVAFLLAGISIIKRRFGTEAAAAWADFALFLPAAVALLI